MLAAVDQIASVAMGSIASLSGIGGFPGTGIAGNGIAPGPISGAGSAPFSDLLKDSVGEVSQLENQAQNMVAGLMTGAGVDIHQAMIATQKASMAFELALAVRNKAVQSYQQVMSMQF